MKSVMAFIKLLNLPCRDMAALVSLSQDAELTRSQRFAVNLHLLYCRACRRFKRQLKIMQDATRWGSEHFHELDPSSALQLSDEQRERLKRSLNK